MNDQWIECPHLFKESSYSFQEPDGLNALFESERCGSGVYPEVTGSLKNHDRNFESHTLRFQQNKLFFVFPF